MRKIDECGMGKFGTLDSSEKTIDIPGDRWWPQTAKQEGDKISNLCKIRKKNVVSAQMLEVSIRSTRYVGTVLRLEGDARSRVK